MNLIVAVAIILLKLYVAVSTNNLIRFLVLLIHFSGCCSFYLLSYRFLKIV